MPFAVVAATDESRVYRDGDARRRGSRLDRGGVAKSLADLERMAAQGLRALPGFHRQKMRQNASGNTIRHQGGKMRSELVQLRCRPTMRRPIDTRLAMTTADAAKPRQPHLHNTEQCRDPMKPPVLDVTSTAARRAVRPQSRMPVGLHSDHRLLHARQKLLRLGQRQPQVRDIAKVAACPDFHHVDTRSGAISLRFDQPQNPPHPRSPGRQWPNRSYRLRPHPPTFWTLPLARWLPDQKSMSPMPPMPPPGGIPGAFFSGFSATIASVVTSRPATDAASCSAVRTTLVGSMMPALTRSLNSPVWASKP